MTEHFSKFTNSCVCLSRPMSSPLIPISPEDTSLLQTINDVVQKTRKAETDAIVRKKLAESTGDDPKVSAALEFLLQNMIEENNRRIVGHCVSCYRGYTALGRGMSIRAESDTGKRLFYARVVLDAPPPSNCLYVLITRLVSYRDHHTGRPTSRNRRHAAVARIPPTQATPVSNSRYNKPVVCTSHAASSPANRFATASSQSIRLALASGDGTGQPNEYPITSADKISRPCVAEMRIQYTCAPIPWRSAG